MLADLATIYNRISLGQATHKLEIGDVGAVVVGCRYPLVLRPLKHTSGFRIIGEAYI